MPIDPTIALQAKNPDIQSPIALQGQYMTLANLGLQGQTAQLKLAEAKKKIADDESLNQAFKSAATPGGGFDWNSLTQTLVGSGNAAQLAAVAKLRGTLTNADLTSLKTEKARRDYFSGAIAPIAANPNSTQQDVIGKLNDAVTAGYLPAAEAAQIAAKLPPDGQINSWAIGKQLESADAAKRLDLILGDTKIVKTGGAQTPINTNKLTGESTAFPPVALNTLTPGENQAHNDIGLRASANAHANAATRLAYAPLMEQAKAEAKSKMPPSLSSDAIDSAAQRLALGAPISTVLSRIGYGASGAANSAAIQNRVAEILKEQGVSPADIIQRQNQLKAQSAALNAATIAFGTGKQGDQMRFVSTADNHLDQLVDLGTALNNKDAPLVNRIQNLFVKETGGAAPGNLEAAANLVGQEVVKAIIATGGGEKEREAAANAFASIKSPDQIAGVVNTYKGFIKAQGANLLAQRKAANVQTPLPIYNLPKSQNNPSGTANSAAQPTAPPTVQGSAPPVTDAGWQTAPNGVQYRQVQ